MQFFARGHELPQFVVLLLGLLLANALVGLCFVLTVGRKVTAAGFQCAFGINQVDLQLVKFSNEITGVKASV
jgi:hypothetical protein